jgi:hypothetical protein
MKPGERRALFACGATSGAELASQPGQLEPIVRVEFDPELGQPAGTSLEAKFSLFALTTSDGERRGVEILPGVAVRVDAGARVSLREHTSGALGISAMKLDPAEVVELHLLRSLVLEPIGDGDAFEIQLACAVVVPT